MPSDRRWKPKRKQALHKRSDDELSIDAKYGLTAGQRQEAAREIVRRNRGAKLYRFEDKSGEFDGRHDEPQLPFNEPICSQCSEIAEICICDIPPDQDPWYDNDPPPYDAA